MCLKSSSVRERVEAARFVAAPRPKARRLDRSLDPHGTEEFMIWSLSMTAPTRSSSSPTPARPMGGFQGALAGAKATELGAAAVTRRGRARRASRADDVEQIFMGCVLPAGLGQAPARQAAIGAGLPQSVEATTVNKMCGSGMQAAIMAARRARRRLGRHHRRRRHGEHDQRALPADQAPRRRPHRPRHDLRPACTSTGSRTPMSRGRLMGTFAEETAARLPVHPRGAWTTTPSIA